MYGTISSNVYLQEDIFTFYFLHVKAKDHLFFHEVNYIFCSLTFTGN